jgi:hypothetical protein
MFGGGLSVSFGHGSERRSAPQAIEAIGSRGVRIWSRFTDSGQGALGAAS